MPEETFGRHVVKYCLFPGPRVCAALARSRLGRSGKLGWRRSQITVQNSNLCQGSLRSPLSFFMFVSLSRLSVHQIWRSPEKWRKRMPDCKLGIYSITRSYSHIRMVLRAIWAHSLLEHSTFPQGTCQFPTNNMNFGDGDFPWSRTSKPVRRL